MVAAAGECAELDLDDVDQGEHEEDAADDGAEAGDEHAGAEEGAVDARENLGGMVGGDAGEADPLLEAQGD